MTPPKEWLSAVISCAVVKEREESSDEMASVRTVARRMVDQNILQYGYFAEAVELLIYLTERTRIFLKVIDTSPL